MKIRAHLRALALGFAGAVLLTATANAAEVRVMISGGLTAAFNALVPVFEKQTGNKVLVAYGPSMGTTTNAIPMRLERGEPADVLIMVGYALNDLSKKGKVVAGSEVELVNSPIGVAVKAGAPKPDISSADAVKRALLAANTIAYSDSASGVYVSTEMFKKLGIEEEMKGKARQIPATPVGEIVAKGEGRARLPADQRAEARSRHRHRRPPARSPAEDHGVLGRHRHGFQGARGRQGANKIPLIARCSRRDRQERHGADRDGYDALILLPLPVLTGRGSGEGLSPRRQ